MAKEEQTDSYSHILKYTGLFGGVQGLGILVGIIRNKLIAVILGPQGMGLVSLFNSTVKFVGDSTNFGIPMSAVKTISEEYDGGDEGKVEEAVNVVRYWSLLTALWGTFLCAVLSPLLSWLTFSWNGHTLHFLCLSPVVGLAAVTGGELAILKGVRQLKHLASISVYNMLAALVISVPIYYLFGEAGIVPSLFLMALAQMILTIVCSYKLFPLRLRHRKGLFGKGIGMIKLGTAFVFAGMLGSGADFVIRSYLNNAADTEIVGLYNAGIMMTLTYVGMVFSAMETDYFPRLSTVNHDRGKLIMAVNRQIEVMLLLVAPLLVAFSVGLPVLLPILYSGKFMPAIGMMQIIVFAMYFRAIKLPVEYIPLAKGDSMVYLLLEAIYDVLLVVLVIFLFDKYGLWGAGLAITLAGIVDFLIVFVFARWKYCYRASTNVITYASLQVPLGALAYALTFLGPHSVFYWCAGGILFLISAWISISILKSKSHLWDALKRRLRDKLHGKSDDDK